MCSGDVTQSCTCTLTYSLSVFDGGQTGTWSTSGNNLTLGSSSTSSGTYCVAGSNLVVGFSAGDAGISTGGSSYSVFAKQ